MITTYFMNLLANYTLGGRRTVALPTKLYIGLSSTTPSINGSGVTEPAISSSTGYARTELPQLTNAVNGTVSNDGMISMPESVTAWGTMTHWVIYDSASGGNLLMYGAFENPKSVTAQAAFSIRQGELELSVGQLA
ncbi:MAG: hypothetical protein PUF04_09385 [bacterium]|nr:hypothetical protein [bacterium]